MDEIQPAQANERDYPVMFNGEWIRLDSLPKDIPVDLLLMAWTQSRLYQRIDILLGMVEAVAPRRGARETLRAEPDPSATRKSS